MRWRFVVLTVILGLSVLAMGYWLTPPESRGAFLPSALASIAAAFFILVPVYLLEHRLARSIEAVNVRVEQVAAEFRKTVQRGVNEAIRESWKEMQAAEESFREVRTGEPVKDLLMISSQYGLLPQNGFRVLLPASETLFFRVYLQKAEADPSDRDVVICISRTVRGGFNDMRKWIWPTNMTLDDLIGGPIYNLLVEAEAVSTVDRLAEDVAVPLLETLTLPIKVRMGMVAVVATPQGRFLSVPNSQWVVTERGVSSLTSHDQIPVRSLNFWRIRAVFLRSSEWFKQSDFVQTVDLARRLPQRQPPLSGYWLAFMKLSVLIIPVLLAGASCMAAAVTLWIARFWTTDWLFVDILPYASIAVLSAALLFKPIWDDNHVMSAYYVTGALWWCLVLGISAWVILRAVPISENEKVALTSLRSMNALVLSAWIGALIAAACLILLTIGVVRSINAQRRARTIV